MTTVAPTTPLDEQSGVQRADANTDDWWRSCVDQCIAAFAATGAEFTAFDVSESGVPDPDSPCRWGAAFRRSRAAGLIEPVGYTASRRPTTASSAVRVWRGVVKPPQVDEQNYDASQGAA